MTQDEAISELVDHVMARVRLDIPAITVLGKEQYVKQRVIDLTELAIKEGKPLTESQTYIVRSAYEISIKHILPFL